MWWLWKPIVGTGLLITALIGCRNDTDQSRDHMDEMVGRVNKGQILRQWGQPLARFDEDQLEIWLYQNIVVQFDREGILRAGLHHKH